VELLVKQITIHTEVVDGKKQAKAVVEYRFPAVVQTYADIRASQNYTNYLRRVVQV
jgi:hypothetical protein